jgi:hypothetical protein
MSTDEQQAGDDDAETSNRAALSGKFHADLNRYNNVRELALLRWQVQRNVLNKAAMKHVAESCWAEAEVMLDTLLQKMPQPPE